MMKKNNSIIRHLGRGSTYVSSVIGCLTSVSRSYGKLFRVRNLSLICFLLGNSVSLSQDHKNKGPQSSGSAITYLNSIQDRYHQTFDVYTDMNAAGNHFVHTGRMSDYDDRGRSAEANTYIPVMNQAFEDESDPDQKWGTCIEAEFKCKYGDDKNIHWGGWYFMNGVLKSGGTEPVANWGEQQKAGFNLRGATRLNFYARGEKGGERVKFFCFGVGRNPQTGKPNQKYPDSAPIQYPREADPSGFICLDRDWKLYTIPLDSDKIDTSYALGGFGWVTSEDQVGFNDIRFYLDRIRFSFDTDQRERRLQEPRFMVSYDIINSERIVEIKKKDPLFHKALMNVAYVYDNALALLAFLAAGDHRRAGIIANAFGFAMNNDPDPLDAQADQAPLQSAYQAGDIKNPPGWVVKERFNAVRDPGFYSKTESNLASTAAEGQRKEKEEGPIPDYKIDWYNISYDAGNMAWAMIALLAYHEIVEKNKEESKHLENAKKLGNWIEVHFRDDSKKGGYRGRIALGEGGTVKKLKWKSTEHAIDLYAAFGRLYEITGDEVWKERCEHALAFLKDHMWSKEHQCFYTGTNEDEDESRNEAPIPLDAQTWAFLALKEIKDIDFDPSAYRAQFRSDLNNSFIEKRLRFKEGYDFSCKKPNSKPGPTGIWFEGTAQVAVLYKWLHPLTGNSELIKRANEIIKFLHENQVEDGALPTTYDTYLWTGFFLPDGTKWNYYACPHIGATAWFVFAEKGVNPYWLGM